MDALIAILFYTLAASALVYALAGGLFAFGLLALRRSGSETSDGSGESPFVSVVIAARNEEAILSACLERLANQSWPTDRFEVIVVDDNSSDATGSIIRQFEASHGHVRGLRTGTAFVGLTAKKRPMALGIQHARGDIILTTDADCRVPATWVEAMAAEFAPDVGIVVGYSQVKARGSHLSFFEKLQGLDFLALMSAAAGSARLGVPLAASGQNFAYRKCLYEEVGGFTSIGHRASGDDVLLLQLMRRRGWRTVFAHRREAGVSTWRSEPPSGFLQQRRRWASNAGLQLRLNPLFFTYLASVFLSAALIPVGLAMEPLREVAIAAFACRVGVDALVISLGAFRFGRTDLLPVLPAWELAQIPYLLLVGVLGTFGSFSWKGARYSAGRSAVAGPAG